MGSVLAEAAAECNGPSGREGNWKGFGELGTTHMSGTIVVSEGLGASKALQQRVCGEYHVFDVLDFRSSATTNSCDVLHDAFSRFRLSRTGFATDDHALIILVRNHVVVGALCYRVDVRRHLQTILSPVRS